MMINKFLLILISIIFLLMISPNINPVLATCIQIPNSFFTDCSCSTAGCDGLQYAPGRDDETFEDCTLQQSCNTTSNSDSCGTPAQGGSCDMAKHNPVTCGSGSQCTGVLGDGCGYCQSPTCNNNGVQDNGETGVDCGGGGCGACAPSGGGTTNPPASTPAPVNPAGCDSNQLTMTASPDPVTQGNNITFSNSSSGSQGSAYIGDSWSGGVNCSGAFWGSKTCLANASGNFSWTHYWGLGTDGSTHCSKSINYVINAAPTASITGPTTGAVNTALSYTATAHDSGGELNKIGIYISPTSSQSWLTPYLESAFTKRWDGSYTATWTPTSTGTYYVVTNAYNSLGGKCTGNPFGIPDGWTDCGNSAAITVTTTLTPSGTCSVSKTTVTTNATDTTTYSATASGGNGTYTYAWTFSDGTTCGVSACTKNFPTTPGTISASLTLSSAGLTSSAILCPDVTVISDVGPWIQAVGDVHSNGDINANGGP